MKKMILVIAVLLIGLTSATATEHSSEMKGKKLEITKRYRFMQPILFVERGVEFLIFPNGEFDFNSEINNPSRDVIYRSNNSRRSSINSALNINSTSSIKYMHSRGTIIQHDRLGRVSRVGNVFINYDSKGRVERVGSIYMKYRHDQLKQVGGLTIQYNRFGSMVALKGQVNHHNQGCGFCGITSCSVNHFDERYADTYVDEHWYDDNGIYYYSKKEDKKKKKGKRL